MDPLKNGLAELYSSEYPQINKESRKRLRLNKANAGRASCIFNFQNVFIMISHSSGGAFKQCYTLPLSYRLCGLDY
jgi:hypothetical protein